VSYCNVVCFMHWIFFSVVTPFSHHKNTGNQLLRLVGLVCIQWLFVSIESDTVLSVQKLWRFDFILSILALHVLMFSYFVLSCIKLPVVAHKWWIVLINNEYRFSSLDCVTTDNKAFNMESSCSVHMSSLGRVAKNFFKLSLVGF